MSDLAPPLSLPEGSTSFQPGSNSSTSLNVGSAAQSQRQIQIHLPNSTGIEALSADKFPYEEFMGRWEVVWSTLPLWKGKKDVSITYTPLSPLPLPTPTPSTSSSTAPPAPPPPPPPEISTSTSTANSTPNSASADPAGSSTGQQNAQKPKIKFDDLVEYRKQSASSDSKASTVKGVDTLDEDPASTASTFNWRGKGWLMVASSRWQVLGYHININTTHNDDGRISIGDGIAGGNEGRVEGEQTREKEGGRGDEEEKEDEWAVTYFSKTLFTPAGIDIYLRRPLSPPQTSPSSTVPEVNTNTSTKTNATEVLLQAIVQELKGMEGEIGELARGGFVVGRE